MLDLGLERSAEGYGGDGMSTTEETLARLQRQAIAKCGPLWLESENGEPVVWLQRREKADEPGKPDVVILDRIGGLSADTSSLTKAQQKRFNECAEAWDDYMRAWRNEALTLGEMNRHG